MYQKATLTHLLTATNSSDCPQKLALLQPTPSPMSITKLQNNSNTPSEQTLNYSITKYNNQKQFKFSKIQQMRELWLYDVDFVTLQPLLTL